MEVVSAGDDGLVADWRLVHNEIIPTDPLSTDDIRERAQRNHLEVGYLGDEVVGCSTVRPPNDETPAVTVIARVLPPYRGRGFGEQLYRRGLAKAEELDAKVVETIVLGSNVEGLHFAQRHGFVEVERYVLPGDTIPFVTLRLSTHSWLSVADTEHVEQIRQDPAYRAGGVLHLALEVIAYPLDEAVEGTTTQVRVVLHADGSIAVSDNGRGTAVRFDDGGVPMVKPIMATRDLRFFADPDSPRLPDGLPRAGMSVPIALSEWAVHTNHRTEGSWTRRYEHGMPRGALTAVPADSSTGTTIHFRPDRTLFGEEGVTPEALSAACAGFATEVPIAITQA
ncbi:GCN5-related N-acetyltransferase [Kribbella flavida DSM 17836]|uniref:DNA topoisomerase (ATP-hydrolyzing) n=1 Tax=Kribbella flavida (strain DSM 17836 / JCM 10339 / NBRC 14399) TaxID=479435 RepID=D2PP74_KRIFD|nr:GCN5-related N-acetyltransferase [Kribbella flavida DSM 17836]